jgi:hypothetical protein
MFQLWLCYFLGALLSLGDKLRKYLSEGSRRGKTLRESLREWFFECSSDNVVSWGSTIGVVWLFGYYYIYKIDAETFGFDHLPYAAPSAFLLGVLAEYWAPDVAKLILSKGNLSKIAKLFSSKINQSGGDK